MIGFYVYALQHVPSISGTVHLSAGIVSFVLSSARFQPNFKVHMQPHALSVFTFAKCAEPKQNLTE